MTKTPSTALITGASSGIGLELAHLFAADRCNLVLVARSTGRLESLAEALRAAHGVDVRVLPADLAKANAPKKIFDALADTRIDYLINNAGFGARGAFAELDDKRQLDMLQVNITALTQLTRLFLPSMLERKRGGVLNVASVAAFTPGPDMAVYFASKAYVLSLSEALSEEVAGSGVHVCCLAPGPTHTGFADEAGLGDNRLFALGAMSAAAVARAGYDGLRHNRALVIPGFGNEMGTVLARVTPRAVVRGMARYFKAWDTR